MLLETRRRTERYLKKKKDANSLIIRGNRLARPLAHADKKLYVVISCNFQ